MESTWIARTHRAFGRFLFSVFLVSVGAVGCAGPPSPSRATPGPRLPEPVVQPGEISPAREAQAAEMYRDARVALQAGRAGEALRTAREIVSSFPSAPVSGRALLLEARAALQSRAFAEADSAAGRYAGLLPSEDPRAGDVRLLQAEAQDSLGNGRAALERLLAIGPSTPAATLEQARAVARSLAGDLGESVLKPIIAELPRSSPLAPIVATRYGLLLLQRGAADQAREYARMALAAGATGPDSVTAASVARGELPEGVSPSAVKLGTFLPTTGSPRMSAFGALVAEGVEVAVASSRQQGIPVETDARDDQGDPTVAASTIQEVEGAGLVGAVGFLEDRVLMAAAGSRTDTFPLVSPTARLGTTAPPGVYSLAGADPTAAAEMAEYAVKAGIQRVAIIHSRIPESVSEAAAFTAAAQSLGLPVVGTFSYDVGSTSFGPQILAARDSLRQSEIAALNLGPDDTLHVEDLSPVALFLPVPAEDIEYLAPQVTFNGLDTLAIQVMGTDGWTDPQVLKSVDQRHTTGVVATAAVDAGPGSPGYARFREAYESHFQRSLVSPVPALGYDAALVLLSAVQDGARTPAEVGRAIAHLQNLQGATGVFSVQDGQLVRRTHVVRLDHGTLVPVG